MKGLRNKWADSTKACIIQELLNAMMDGGREQTTSCKNKQQNYLLKNEITHHHNITKTLQVKSFLNTIDDLEGKKKNILSL